MFTFLGMSVCVSSCKICSQFDLSPVHACMYNLNYPLYMCILYINEVVFVLHMISHCLVTRIRIVMRAMVSMGSLLLDCFVIFVMCLISMTPMTAHYKLVTLMN